MTRVKQITKLFKPFFAVCYLYFDHYLALPLVLCIFSNVFITFVYVLLFSLFYQHFLFSILFKRKPPQSWRFVMLISELEPKWHHCGLPTFLSLLAIFVRRHIVSVYTTTSHIPLDISKSSYQ